MPRKDPEARRAYDRERRERNREKLRAQHKAWRDANKERVAGYKKRWAQARPEVKREIDRRHKARKREDREEAERAYAESLPGLIEEQAREMRLRFYSWGEAPKLSPYGTGTVSLGAMSRGLLTSRMDFTSFGFLEHQMRENRGHRGL